MPVAAVFALRAVGTSSPSWAAAAAIHGISAPAFLRRVLLPWAAPFLALAGALVVLLGLADVTSALLLHAPGKDTLPLAIFTVMANAPESYVAALCLVYITVVVMGATIFLGVRLSWSRK